MSHKCASLVIAGLIVSATPFAEQHKVEQRAKSREHTTIRPPR